MASAAGAVHLDERLGLPGAARMNQLRDTSLPRPRLAKQQDGSALTRREHIDLSGEVTHHVRRANRQHSRVAASALAEITIEPTKPNLLERSLGRHREVSEVHRLR